MTDARLDNLERRIRTLESELADLRRIVAAEEPGAAPAPPVQVAERPDLRRRLAELDRAREKALWESNRAALLELRELLRELEPELAAAGLDVGATSLASAINQGIRRLAGTGPAAPVTVPEADAPSVPQPSPPPLFSLPELEISDLLGAKALAIAGGIVTLLGIVFFFVLAVNRGWIGPGGRVALGAVAAALVYSAGLELRRRYGATHSALAAVGAGIAGGYAVLLAAVALYHFLSHPVALVVAAAIAAVGTVTALRWSSQLVAGLGLLGATLAPLAVAAQGGLSVVGVWFAAFMAVATATVALRQRWDVLLVLGALASLPQALALALQARYEGESPVRIVALAAVFSAIVVAIGITRQLRERTSDPGPLTPPFLFVGAAFAVGCALRLYGSSESRGFALLVIAIAFGVTAAAFFPRERDRDLSALLGALGLVVGGIAFGELMSGSPLAFAWAGEAAVLAWLARQVKEVRYQLFALLYFGAALVHVLAIDAPPSHLFRAVETSAGGALAVVAVGLAAGAVGFFATPGRAVFTARGGLFGALAPLFEELAAAQGLLRVAAYWLAGLAALYAISLGVLAAVPSFGWGHVAMYALWSAIGLGLFTFGLRRQAGPLRVGGLVLLGGTAFAAVANGEALLGRDPRAAACLIAGLALLAAALAELFVVIEPRYEGLREDERVFWLSAGWLAVAGAVGALSVGVVAAVPSHDWGHVTMFAVWSALALGVLLAALRRQAGQIRAGALAGLVVTLVAAFAYGEAALGSHARGVAFLVVGAAVLAAALADQLLPRRRELGPVGLGLVLAGVGVGLAAFVALLGGTIGSVDERGLGFLGLAALFGVLAGAVFRLEGQRDLATLFWGAALVLAYGSSQRLLPGTYHVLALSLAAGALAWLSLRAREPRFLGAAAVSVLVGFATVVFSLAPPGHLFSPHEHPGHGALGALFVALAAAVVAYIVGEDTELRRRGRSLGFWVAGVLTVYGLSVFILALFQASFAGSVDTNFHRGHTAVSAFWGLIGLTLLYFGLTRLRALRVAGFAMFTVSLAKIFLFDLPSLSSITRALSFLAVGAVLLAGGFFYQRLATAQPAQPRRHRRPLELPRTARPDLLVALLAAAALIVWFGTGSEPLGKSARPQATRPAAGSGTSAPNRALAPLPPPGSRCTLEAQEIGGATFVFASGCGKAVTGVTVVLGGAVVSPAYYMTSAESAALSCPVQGSRVRCRVKPPLPPGSLLTLTVIRREAKDTRLRVSVAFADGSRQTSSVKVT